MQRSIDKDINNFEDIKSHPFLAFVSPIYKVDESTINNEKGVDS